MTPPKHSHHHNHDQDHEHDHEHDHDHEHCHSHNHNYDYASATHQAAPQAQWLSACHNHEPMQGALCGHEHVHLHGDKGGAKKGGTGSLVLTVRATSGLSGDMMLAGLALMAGCTGADLEALVALVGCTPLHGCVTVEPRVVNHVAGWGCRVDLPHEHAHRTMQDIEAIIGTSSMPARAKELTLGAFTLLAEAEGAVHGKPAQEVTFHEVGALDSILDICLVCLLFHKLGEPRFVCSPLPLADGQVWCAHGCLPVPAPAVLRLLEGVPVCAFAGKGETVTPTAIALLKALGAEFGGWPAMRVERTALVYGSRVFENAPNGVVWAVGKAL